MAAAFPAQVKLDAEEVRRINRVRVAQYYHKFPHEVDEMPEMDYQDTLEILWADNQRKPRK